MEIRSLIGVMIGGALGAAVRYSLSLWMIKRYGPQFPWGTLLINLSGCFALGLLIGLRLGGRHPMPEWLTLSLAAGFLGAYTTFSTFGVETVLLLESRQAYAALAYVASSVLIGIAAAGLGIVLGRSL
ncbi:MAG: fluoride efflux transporter CrcB [Armatimonadetes bacterium]|nr:fluoride efflux transporter CrcB [Armatimonadota bacterium]